MDLFGGASPTTSRPGEPLDARGKAFSIAKRTHGPDPGTPLHIHREDDEAWHVIDGVLRFTLDDETVDVEAGGSVFVPAGVPHRFQNPGPGDVTYLVITTPRVFQLDAALAKLDDPSDLELAATYARFGSALAR